MQSGGRDHVVNYYTILGLPYPQNALATQLSRDDLKIAYHRALLLHHPDKVARNDSVITHTPDSEGSSRHYSIDEIMRAYQVLTEPALKVQYDSQLLQHKPWSKSLDSEAFARSVHLGVESYDLEELEYNESNREWSKPCRCGDSQGYTVTETELEKESEHEEVYVGCRGCSLFIKVLFASIAEGDEVETNTT